MKATVVVLLVLVAAVSAQMHGSIGRGSIGRSSSGMGGHRMGRSLIGAPILASRPVGVIGRPMAPIGIAHHRIGRSVLLTAPVAPVVWRGGLMSSKILASRGLLI